jgi:hypothetical protein
VLAGGDSSPSAPGSHATWTGPVIGQAPSIDANASGLANYASPNESRPAEGILEEDEELSRTRGTFKNDEEVRKLTAWTTLRDYPTHVGISLSIRDWVSPESHEIPFWEEVMEAIQIVEHHASEMYDWLVGRLRGRAGNGTLPEGMPDSFTGLSVRIYPDGKAGYILFELLDSFASSLTDMLILSLITLDSELVKVTR